MAVVTFTPHKHQAAVLADLRDYLLVIAGKRGGKSAVSAVKFISNVARDIKCGRHGDYLILGPTYGLLRNGTIPTLLKYWPRKLGVYRRSESRIQLPNGPDGQEHYIYIISADEPDRIEAFGILGAWLDEAGQFKQEAWTKVQQRMTTEVGMTGWVLISTTPYGVPKSWLNQDLIARRSEMPWVGYHNWSTLDNPFIDHTAVERAKLTMHPQIYRRDVEGVYTSIEGLIYPDWSRAEDSVKPFKVPEHWPVFGGADYGFTDPTCILIIAKDPESGTFYVIDEYYRSKGEMQDQQAFLEKWRGKLKICLYDPSNPGWWNEMRNLTKMNLVAADNEVESGIARITRISKTGRLKVFNTCINLCDAMESYVYAEGKNKPHHDNSHAPDALRYAFSKDLLKIYPELKRPTKAEDFKKNFNEKGEFIPPPVTAAQIFDLKDTKNKRKSAPAREPHEALEYKPKFDPWTQEE